MFRFRHVQNILPEILKQQVFRDYSNQNIDRKCKLLVLGGGAGGCTIAAKFAPKIGKENIVILEPSDVHYYQPMFTLVGGGIKHLNDTHRLTKDVLPKDVLWLQDQAINIDPVSSSVKTAKGTNINYEYLVVAVGLELHYEKIPGLEEALAAKDSGVCSNYSPKYVTKTLECLQQFQEGTLICTYPSSLVKCPGAPLKICMIAEDYLRKHGKRNKANVCYYSTLDVIFAVKKYADSLWTVCKSRDINVNLRKNLVSVDHVKKTAVFQDLNDKDKENKISVEYSFLHVTPPMGPPAVVSSAPDLADGNGYLNVDKHTTRHKKFPNIFGIGDCTNLPISKTTAAVAAQSYVLFTNLSSVIDKQELKASYNGYTSCPLVSSLNTCILAEFDYNLTPTETFPFIDQSKESKMMFVLKKDLMPWIYWNLMTRGLWNGPDTYKHMLGMGTK